MRSTRPNKEGYFIFSAEGLGSYEEAFDNLVKQVRSAEEKFVMQYVGGPSWKMAEDQKNHFVITQAADLTNRHDLAVTEKKATKGAKDGKGK